MHEIKAFKKKKYIHNEKLIKIINEYCTMISIFVLLDLKLRLYIITMKLVHQ